MNDFQSILDAARSLPPAQKAEMLLALHDDLPPEDWPSLSEEWLIEVNRRSDAVDRGEMPIRRWSEIRTDARRRAGLDG